MKKLLFILALFTLTSFSDNGETPFPVKNIKTNFVRTAKDLYVSRYEVSNLDYRSFLADLLTSPQVGVYNHCFPDTLVWQTRPSHANPLVQFYFRHPSYDNYPVVGVSYAAALEYCKWLTEKYNQDAKRKQKKVLFRLPNKEEWTHAANKGDSTKLYTWGSGFMQNNRRQYLCNFNHKDFDSAVHQTNKIQGNSTIALAEKTAILSPINSFYPNSFGIFNMCGNVAEMVAEKGIAKGGGFDDPAYMVRIASEKTYAKPQADIGFRVAMQVIED